MEDDIFNQKSLKRLENGQFTTATKGELDRLNETLCAGCGAMNMCPVLKAADSVRDSAIAKAYGVKGAIKVCASFAPIFEFQKSKGLDLDSFNTVRLGSAWHKRLRVNDRVSVNSKKEGFLGFYIVTRLELCSMDELLEKHAAYNHMTIGLEPDIVNHELLKALRSGYGSGYVARAESFSVIYMRPDRRSKERIFL